MHRTFSKVAIVGAAFVVIVGLTIVMPGQEALRQRTGFPQDWSHSHLVFSDPGSFAQATRNGSFVNWYRIMNDPRFQMQRLRRYAAALQPQQSAAALQPQHIINPKPIPLKPTPLDRDWNFSLQTTGTSTGVPPNRYPAKYSFNPLATANCAGDFAIFGLNVAGSSGQANLVGVNNLYVGTAGTGCSSPPGNNGGSGSEPTPQVMWAFNVATGSPITTSVVLSLGGTKVAYVVNSSTPALQVLTLPSTQSGTVTTPTSPSTTCNGPAPSVCSVPLTGSGGDGNSSPFVDYATDTAYVGDNSGHLYKVTNVFTGTPALAGGSWPVAAGSSILGAPVYDAATNTVFVGSEDGKLYGFNATTPGTGISGSPLTLAQSVTLAPNSYGIQVAPPIVDSTNHVLYEFYGSNAITTLSGCASVNSCAEVAQVVFTSTPTFSGSTTTSLATAGTNLAAFSNTLPNIVYITDGAFSDSYFSGFDSTTSFLYACGALSTGAIAGMGLQQFSFNSNRILQTTVHTVNSDYSSTNLVLGGAICSPLTEFYNTSTATDWLFLSVPAVDKFRSFKISGISLGGAVAENANNNIYGGSSGIIVDGASTYGNASSIYFTQQTPWYCTHIGDASPPNTGIGSTGVSGVSNAICGIKLTQSGLSLF